MYALLTFYSFVLGTVFGSFINVVVYRFDTGVGLNGRSRCGSCGAALGARDLVPLFSYLFLGGRCRRCHSRISFRYPLVELTTGILFALGFWKQFSFFGGMSPTFLLCYFTLVVFLVLIAAYDTLHKVIPDEFIFPFIILSFVYSIVDFVNLDHFLSGMPHGALLHMPPALDVLAPLILALPLALLWFFSSGRLIGLGDAKLAWGIAWLLGLLGGISALFIGFWLGALWSLAALAAQYLFRSRRGLFSRAKKITMKSEIPLGPFLIAGLIVVWLFNASVFFFIVR